MNQYPNFIEAANELDELSLEGIFGEVTRKLVEQRELVSQTDYFVTILDEWLSETNQYGKPIVKRIMMLFIKLYIEAFEINPEETIEVLAAYWRGTKDNPESEGISGYTETVRYHHEAKRIITELEGKSERKLSEQKHAMASFLTAYSKSVEYIGQILVPCIQLVHIINGEQVDTIRVIKSPLYEKVKLFNEASSNKYKAITDVLNRDIRNADSHLNIRYVPSKGIIEYKKRMGAKIKTYEVTVHDWFLNIYPKVGWVIQAYIYSGVLICIGFSNKPKFIEKYKQIFNSES